MNFFQHETYLHARVPRVECPQGCGIKTVNLPWTRALSGFTALFEALIMVMVREMPVAAVATMVGEHDTRIWRLLHHHVEEARAEADFSEVLRVGMDETASRRGHNYISFFFDLDKKRLLYGAEGRDQSTGTDFAVDLSAHGGDPEQIQQACSDCGPHISKA